MLATPSIQSFRSFFAMNTPLKACLLNKSTLFASVISISVNSKQSYSIDSLAQSVPVLVRENQRHLCELALLPLFCHCFVEVRSFG